MEENVPPGSVCCFCLTTYENEALYGKFYKIEELTTHYFCLLLSAKVQQRGSDNEGILGFLPYDIRAEVRRGKSLVCLYCHKRGATISCHSSKCKTHFHLPCGRAKDTFHQFFGEFKSFCFRHRKTQTIKKEVLLAMSGKQSTCSICLESVPATPSPSTIWAPCCSKEAWFHRLCIQRLALSAGYFFKCPLCNNTNRFVESMRTCGIWIPEQDASWERDPDRYDGLLQRHNSCDAKSCRCKQGRTFHMENTKWEIKLCSDCGSQGMHVHCGNLRVMQDWVCAICANVMSPKKDEKTGRNSLARQSIVSRSRARRYQSARPVRRLTRQQQDEEEEKAEMDENLENTEVTSPGPIKGIPSGSERGVPLGMCKGAPMTSKGPVAVPVTHMKPILNEQRDFIPSIVRPASDKEDNDVEIIDLEENSDDEVQILPTPNIRFIKTNSGLSVPVVKVHASQPAGEEVIASGEPCQPTCSISHANLDSTKDDKYMDLCEPCTSQSVGVQEPFAVSSDDSATERPSCSSSSEDEIVVEFERTSQIAELPEVMERPTVIVSPVDDVGIENTESVSRATRMLIRNAPSPITSKQSAEQPSYTSHLSFPNFTSSEVPNSSTCSASAHLIDHESVINYPLVCLSNPSMLQTLLAKDIQNIQTTSGFHKLFSKDDSNTPVQGSLAARKEQLKVPTMEPERFFSVSDVLPPTAQNALDLTVTSVSGSSVVSTSMYSSPTQTDSGRSSMSSWHSKMLQVSKEDANFTQLSSLSETVPNSPGTAHIQPSQTLPLPRTVPMSSCDAAPSSYHPTVSSDSFSTFPDARTYLGCSNHPNALAKGNTTRIQLPLFSDVENQSPADWSVEVVPTSNQIGVNNFVSARPDANYPGVIYDCTSGAATGETLWGDDSLEDEIIVVDDEPLPLQLDDTAKRKRKQRIVERHEFSQCRGREKKEPLACTCKRNRRSRWSWDLSRRRSFSSDLSSYCPNRGKKYIHHGKSSSSSIKDSENNLLTRFFSSLASCSGTSLQRGEPCYHSLFVIHRFENPQNNRASGLETTDLKETFSSGSIAGKSTNLSQWIQKRSLSNPCEDGASLKGSPRKKLKLSPDLEEKAESSRICWNRRESDNSFQFKGGSQNNSSLHQGRISLVRRQLEKRTPQKSGSQRSKSETRARLQKETLPSLVTPQTLSRMQTRSSFRRVSESVELQNIENEIDSSSKSHKTRSGKRTLASKRISKKKPEQASNESGIKSSPSSVNSSNTSSASKYNLKSRSLRTRSSTLRRTCCDSNALRTTSRCKNDQRRLSSLEKSRAKKESNNTIRLRSGSRFSGKGLVKKNDCRQKLNSSQREDSELVIHGTKNRCLPVNREIAKIGNGLALAGLSSFQPVVILERSFSRRERSVSVERPTEQKVRLQGGRSRREQFLKKKEVRTARRAVSHSPRSFQSRSPIRTRSRSRAENSRLLLQAGDECSSKTCQLEMLQQQNSNELKSVLTLDSGAPTKIHEVYIDRVPSSEISSSDSYITQRSDETEWEMIVEEDHIRDAIASMSDDSCFSPVHDETDYEIVVEEDHITDTIATMSELRASGKSGFNSQQRSTSKPTFLQSSTSNGNYDRDKEESSDSDASSSFNWFHLSRNSSSHFSADSNFPFSSSFQPSDPPSPSFPHTPVSMRSRSLSFSGPCPSFTSMQPPSSGNSNSTSPPPSHLPADVLSSSLSMGLAGLAKSANQVSCQLQLSMSSQPNSSTEPLESLSGNHPTFSVPSPRRSPRSPHNSVPSYNYRAVKKALLDTNTNPLCVRRSSPPPIFPKRSGSPTEMECRIKARALTARKFVPMSRIATEQRETVRQLQIFHEKQCNPKK